MLTGTLSSRIEAAPLPRKAGFLPDGRAARARLAPTRDALPPGRTCGECARCCGSSLQSHS